MLFTRCPDCHTTFRITDEALRKAEGQVRCGRCSNIFNAYMNLRERHDAPVVGAADPAPSVRESAPRAAGGEKASPATVAAPPVHRAPETGRAAEPVPEPEPSPEPEVADMVAEIVLADPGQRPPELLWTLLPVEEPAPRRGRLWPVAAALAGLLLLGQFAHSLSADLATRPVIGPLVQRVYATLGVELVPRWNLDDYEVIDATAATEPGAPGHGSLVITARVRNRGSRPQPYPHVQLQLLDRWERAVGKRVFAPAEYLAAAVEPDALLEPGSTAAAQLVVVDPGPEAAGFELDVCVRGGTQPRCAADDVFE